MIRGERAAALVSFELTSLMDGIDILRSRVGTLTDTDPEYVWITVSHTFSAPYLHVGQSAGPGGPGDREAARSPEELALRKKQTEALLDAVDAAAKQAYASLRPARIGYGTGTAQVNTGRDVETAEGWWLTEGSTAYADHNLGVIRFDDLDARPIAVIYNFAVQSSVLDHAPMSDGGLVVSGDLAGAASEAAERRYPGAVALFLCGAAGDQAPRKKGSSSVVDETGRLQHVERYEEGIAIKNVLGDEFGEALCNVIASVTASEETAAITAESRVFPVPAKKMLPRGEVKAHREIVWQPDGFRESNVDALRIGNAVLLGVKPELSASIGAQIREVSPFQLTMVATMVNGSAQYMADKLAFERITYAAQSGPFAAGAAEILREHAVALAGHMAEQTN